jgi:carbon starvation protein
MTVFGLFGLLFAVWGGQFLAQFPAIENWFRHDQMARLGRRHLRFRGFRSAGLVVADSARLSEHFLKLGTVVALAMRDPDPSNAPNAGPFALHRRQRSRLRRTGFSLRCITIACGAVSGFHSLIASGTTPKMLERESRIRDIGYGAMVTEMMVALMALIAACVLQPGQYFAINAKGTPSEVVAKVSAAGFPVSEPEMKQLASDLGESTCLPGGRRPTFAWMAHMFARVSASPTPLRFGTILTSCLKRCLS